MPSNDSDKKIRAAFDQYLGYWLDARNNLIHEQTSVLEEEITDNLDWHKMDEIMKLFKKKRNLRISYGALEIFAPVAFAVFAILYFWGSYEWVGSPHLPGRVFLPNAPNRII